MEGGVEAGDLGEIRAEGAQGVDGGQTGGVVQGGEIGECLQGGVGPIVEEDGAGELGAAMDDTVTGGIDAGGAAEEFLQHAGQLGRLLVGKVTGDHGAPRFVQQAKL